MSDKQGRKPIILKNILETMADGGFLNTNLVLGLRDWDEGIRNEVFHANSPTEDDKVARTSALLRGLENPEFHAKLWVTDPEALNPDSEVGLRARLSDEMAFCLRRGGVILSGGEISQQVPQAVEQVIYGLKPELKAEVQIELSKETNDQSHTIEGSSPPIA